LATIESEEVTMFTPEAPIRAVPSRLVLPVLLLVTEELFAAIDPADEEEVSVCPAVT
jgi:hypothetical protein